jgi:hypothetical protein
MSDKSDWFEQGPEKGVEFSTLHPVAISMGDLMGP